ncbi:MAG: SUMF1/EgtB/PvdO family nonheme iron enzyme [Proteobacteria bacterium]|nr:SUMF1/EgtB/PvdO family nonheme iron enzyme [Pseudomonadota bacterium]
MSKPDAERRVALVIGNGAYQAGAALANPANDARAMSAKLRKLGFDVIAVENGTQQSMRRAIGQFSNKLTADAVSLFYYAGHGMQVNGRNYLIPIDAEISTEQTVRLETIDVDAVIDQMSMAKSRVNLVILDACRNNPYERRFRSQSGGLATIEAPTGTLIAYATSPGRVAADGDTGNGLYTSELLAAMDVQSAKVEDVFKRVRLNVVARSRGEQTPWEASSLTGDFYFIGPTAATATAQPGAAVPTDRDVAFWYSVKDSRSAAQIQAYLDQFPQGTFAGLAKVVLDDLTRGQVAAVPAKPDVTPRPGTTSGYPAAVGQSFRDCADCPEMVVIPPGAFLMGSEHSPSEKPVHRVRVGQALAVGKFPVTVGEAERAIADVPRIGRVGSDAPWRDPGFSQTDRHPVVRMTWGQAKLYVDWLSRKTARTYRLLTEAEWEYAARGGTSTAYWWGDDIGAGNTVCDGCGSKWDNLSTAPVGSFAPNPFGLYDMLGNAAQWLEDCWQNNYDGASGDAAIALVSGDCGSRALRGGFWGSLPWNVRAASRSKWSAEYLSKSGVGFRVVRMPGG